VSDLAARFFLNQFLSRRRLSQLLIRMKHLLEKEEQ